MPELTTMLSPNVRNVISEWLTASCPTSIFQKFSLVEVSSTTLSVIAMSTMASFIETLSSATVSAARSMPCDCRARLPILPFIIACGMKPSVLTCISSNDSSSITMFWLSSGSNCISTMVLPMLAIVSRRLLVLSGFITFTPTTLRSSGKARRTRSTEISMPVFSDAYTATCLTAQFWNGGK